MNSCGDYSNSGNSSPGLVMFVNNFLNKSNDVRIRGMAHSSYFFSTSNIASMINLDGRRDLSDEGGIGIRICSSLYLYLLHQGYTKDEVMIITLDETQAKLIQMTSAKDGMDFQVEIVDKFNWDKKTIPVVTLLLLENAYYGVPFECNDIVEKVGQLLLTLTQADRTTNGLYIIGDANGMILMHDNGAAVARLYEEKKLLGCTLHLKCSSHGTGQSIRSPEDFPLNGGCYEVCNERLRCGHICSELCHPSFDHDQQTICTRACGKLCGKGHPCEAQCHPLFDCEPCQVVIPKKFCDCEHTVSFTCCEVTEDTWVNMECNETQVIRLPCNHEMKIKCSETRNENISESYQCQRFKLKKLPCKHPKALRCSQSTEGAKCKKTVAVPKLLKCGHYFRVLTCCYKRERVLKKNIKKKCAFLCSMTLSCGHPCQFECVASNYSEEEINPENHEKKHPCMQLCRRICPRKSHECGKQHPCTQSCPPCKAEVSFKFDGCGCNHTKSVPCHDFDTDDAKYCDSVCTRERPEGCDHPCPLSCQEHVQRKDNKCPPCKILVTKTRPCMHEVDIPCGQDIPKTDLCQEECDLRNFSSCGHNIRVVCNQVEEILQKGEANYYCTSRCNFFFDPKLGGCGHTCEGWCSFCAKKRFHEPCSKTCGKLQFCGHECKEPCSSTCPPCGQICQNFCEHSSCDHICSLPCNPCKEPCSYSCPHGKCTRRCNEICNKKPCMKRCPIQKECGHLCIGYCGEPCPPLCAICDEKELLDQDLLALTTIDTEKDRFVLLVDCGHTIHAEALERLMMVDIEKGQILPKKCPFCPKEIRNCNRFKKIILKIRADIESVKTKIYGNRKEIRQKQVQAVKFLACSKFKSAELFIHLKDQIICELMMETPFGYTADNFQKMSIGKAECLAFISELYDWSVRMLEEMSLILPSDLYCNLELSVKNLLDVIPSRHWPLTAFDLKIIGQEWERIGALRSLYVKKGTTVSEVTKNLLRTNKGKDAFDKAVMIATGVGPYNDDVKGKLSKAMKTLEEAIECKLGITDAERKSIVKSFGMAPGRWFKCENGHPYIVEECGAPTQESSCNICRGRIGGSYHRVLPSNDLASEMDGAIVPLYPTALTGGD